MPTASSVDWTRLGELTLALVPGGYGFGQFVGQGLATLLQRRRDEWGAIGGLLFGTLGLGGVIGVLVGMVTA